MLYVATSNLLRERYVGSILGMAWLVVYPLVFLCIYSLVYIVVLRVRMPDLSNIDYVITIFAGLVPFLAIAESLGSGVNGIVSNSALIKNTLFPIEFLAVRDVLAGHAAMGFGMLLVWVSAVATGHLFWSQMLLPFIFVVQIVMTIGTVWVLSTLNVFFRDIGQSIPIVTVFLMLVSPIAYTLDMVPADIQFLIRLNPLAWLIKLYRSCLFGWDIQGIDILLLSSFSLGFLAFGYWMIKRLKPLFSDYV